MESKTKEELLKKCNLFSKITLIVEIGIILIAIITLIIAIVTTTQDYFTVDNNTKNEEIISSETNIEPITTIVEISTYILSFIIILNIRKILKNTIKENTPFTKTNIQHVKKISIIVLIITIINLSIYSIAQYIAILTIYYMLKYGSSLQIQSDETL